MDNKVTAEIGQELKRQFKYKCIADDVKVTDVVRHLIRGFVAGRIAVPKAKKIKKVS